MGDVPRWYVPAYLVIKLPIMMLAGAASALAFVLWRERGDNWRRRLETALVVFIAAFPVVCEVIDRGPAYHRPAAFPVRGAAFRGPGRHRLRLAAR